MINHICNYRIAFLITSKKLTNIIFVHYQVCSCLIETSINTLFQLIHVIFHFNFLCTSITSEKNFFFLTFTLSRAYGRFKSGQCTQTLDQIRRALQLGICRHLTTNYYRPIDTWKIGLIIGSKQYKHPDV